MENLIRLEILFSQIANNKTDYNGLAGEIVQIRTDSDTYEKKNMIEFICDFTIPENLLQQKQLEKRFSDLYGCPKKISEIPVIAVRMTKDELVFLGTDKVLLVVSDGIETKCTAHSSIDEAQIEMFRSYSRIMYNQAKDKLDLRCQASTLQADGLRLDLFNSLFC